MAGTAMYETGTETNIFRSGDFKYGTWCNMYLSDKDLYTHAISHKEKKLSEYITEYISTAVDASTCGSLWGETTAATQTEAITKYLYTADITHNHLYAWDKDSAVAWSPPVIAPSVRMRRMIQDRMAPAFHRSRKAMSAPRDVREERARQTLRRIIGDQAFRKFIRDGFITVVPKSGLTYRIYPGHGITEVYDRGIMVDRLCVVLQGNFPPTDSLLMRYLLILNDEGEFSKYAVKHHVSQSKKLVFSAKEAKPLTEAWAELQVA